MVEPLDPKGLEAALSEADRWDEGFTSSPREYQVVRIGKTTTEMVARHDGRGPMEADLKRRRMEAAIRAFLAAAQPAPDAGEPAYVPAVIEFPEGGYAQLVLEDVPTITAETMEVEVLRRLAAPRDIIGFQWGLRPATPSPATGEQ